MLLTGYVCVALFKGASAFQTMPYLPHQPQGYAVHSHFASQTGRHKLIVIVIYSFSEVFFCQLLKSGVSMK